MKTKLLELIEEIKSTGIVASLRDAADTTEFKAVAQKFSDENKDILDKIDIWAEEFRESECGAIFAEGEIIEDPIEIAIILHIINDEDSVSECEICGDYKDLAKAIRDIGDDFSIAVAACAENDYICNITAEKIFNIAAADDGETEAEDGQEDADCGDADEADSDVNLAEAEDH